MPRGPADWIHLIRLSVLIAASVAVFLLVRPSFVPESFGEFGHYRGDAILDGRDRPLRFAGRADCDVCHDDVRPVQRERGSRHATLGCEGCHGPLAAHAADPDEMTPPPLDFTRRCITCHERSAGRPSFLPQVVVSDHSGDEACGSCHEAHTPGAY